MSKTNEAFKEEFGHISNESEINSKACNQVRKRQEVSMLEKRRDVVNNCVYRFIKFYQDYVKLHDTVNLVDMAKYIIDRWLADDISSEEDQQLMYMLSNDVFGQTQGNISFIKTEVENSHFGMDTPSSQASHLVSSPASFLDSAPPFKKRKMNNSEMKLGTFLKYYLTAEEMETISNNSSSKTVTDADKDVIKQCLVCCGRSTGLHYGRITCEGCKGFFKRAVQSRHLFKCAGQVPDHCNILLERRNSCKKCRFRKCLLSGMAPRAVRENHMPGGRNSQAMYAQDFNDSDDNQDSFQTNSQTAIMNSHHLLDPGAFTSSPNSFQNHNSISPSTMLNLPIGGYSTTSHSQDLTFVKEEDDVLKVPSQPACLTSEQLKSAMRQAEIFGSLMSANVNGACNPLLNPNDNLKPFDPLLMMPSNPSVDFKAFNQKFDNFEPKLSSNNSISNISPIPSKYPVPGVNCSIFPFTNLGNPTSIEQFGDVLNNVENRVPTSGLQYPSMVPMPRVHGFLKNSPATDLPDEVTILPKEMATVAIRNNLAYIEGKKDLKPPYCISSVYKPISQLMNERIDAWGLSFYRLHEYIDTLKQKSVLMFLINAMIHFLEVKKSECRPQFLLAYICEIAQNPNASKEWKEISLHSNLLYRIMLAISEIRGTSGAKYLRVLQYIVTPYHDYNGQEDHECIKNLSESLKELEVALFQLHPQTLLKLLHLFLEVDSSH